MSQYSPGEVADRTGFTLDTLRYYERIGLVDGIARGPGGRRVFTDDNLAWLTTLRCLRDTGMPIADMLRYAQLVRDGDRTVTQRVTLLDEHDRKLGEKIARLRAEQRHIREKIARYRSAAA